MKNLITLIAIATFSASGYAGDNPVVSSENGNTTMTLIRKSVAIQHNEHGSLQVEAYVQTYSKAKGTVETDYVAITGCDKEIGGKMGIINEKTRQPYGNSTTWLWNGDSMGDGLGAQMCNAAAMYIEEGGKVIDNRISKGSAKPSKGFVQL